MRHLLAISGIVKIIDHYDSAHYSRIVMNRVEGLDLFDFLTARGALSENIARGIFTQLVQIVLC